MIKDGVIVDTSVLISFFRGQGESADEVEKLLTENRIMITGIIAAELLQGMKGVKEEERLSEFLSALNPIEITTGLWIKAGKLSLSLRRRGLNLPLTDIAIAALAIEHNLSVFTFDKHFEKVPGQQFSVKSKTLYS